MVRQIARATLIALLAGCSSPSGSPATEEPSPVTVPPTTVGDMAEDEQGAAGPAQVAPGMEALVDMAVSDLAGRLSVDAGSVVIVSAEAVTWPDAGLGCPQPDMRYTQVPVDGSLIVLEVGDVTYRYHSGGRRTEPFLCVQQKGTSGEGTILIPPPGGDA